MSKRELRPCVSCGTPVPEHTEYPYAECPPTCELSSRWRREHEARDLYTAADLARARREALEEGIRAINEAFEKDQDVAPQDVLRALTGTPDALRCKCGHSIDAHQSERSSHCLTKGCECAQWAGTPDATKEETT